MAQQIDYYAVLELNRQASAEEVKRAFRRLAVHWHPDRNPGSRLAEERFKAIAEAYAVLSHPVKRRQYDLLGPVDFKNEYSHEEIFQGFEPGDFFSFFGLADARDTLARIFGEAAEEPPREEESNVRGRVSDFFAGFGQKHSLRDGRSPDIVVPLMVTFREAAFGADKFVAYNTSSGPVKFRVTIPAGAESGRKLTVPGLGPAKSGGQPGDVIVVLTVSPDPDFQRAGFDLHTTVAVGGAEMRAGCRLTVTAPEGQSLRLNVPPGTVPGTRFKMPGYGLPKPDGGRGDLLVRLRLE